MEGSINLKITISKNSTVFRDFNEEISFQNGLVGYRDILKKLQTETNSALTELVNQEHSADVSAVSDTDDEEEDQDETALTPKRKNSCDNRNNVKMSKC